jgi:hypothetical protein
MVIQPLHCDHHWSIMLPLLINSLLILGARGSVVGWGTMLQTGRSPVRVPDKVDFSVLLTALWPWIDSASNRNEYRRVGLTTLPSFVSRLSRKCGRLNLSQPQASKACRGENFTFINSTLWNVGLYLWWHHNSHLVPRSTDPCYKSEIRYGLTII